MDTERKTRILYWIIAILAVFNISLLVTVLFFPGFGQDRNLAGPGKEDHNPPDGRHFLTRMLHLNPQQEAVFDSSRHAFFREADTVFKSMQLCREEIFKELSAENPDSVKLFEIADRMGMLHSELKRSTIHHFMLLRKECTPEQQKKLNEIFGKMISNEPQFQGPHQFRNRRMRPDSNIKQP